MLKQAKEKYLKKNLHTNQKVNSFTDKREKYVNSAVLHNCHWFYMMCFQVLCWWSSAENPETKSCRCISQWRSCFVLKSCIVSLHNKISDCEITKPVDICSPIKWAQLLLGTLLGTRNVSAWSTIRACDSSSLLFLQKILRLLYITNTSVSHRQSNLLCIGFYFSVTITKRAAWGKRRNCSGFVLF